MSDLNIILIGLNALNNRTVLFMHRSLPFTESSDSFYGIVRYILRNRAIPYTRTGESFHRDLNNKNILLRYLKVFLYFCRGLK